ncbi:MAG TPA: peptide chain release factor N(5)-glutamine methyltransferase [Acholeplasmataceae bacterium]|nr:peptide chain release factor N(5)-glutamine methyltransferase [Acholeplasmataceae bacterium]HBO66944.1 peptide chain release factor N(5)-glutamine methyltransferase [Acholeplasmataceae bacterium]HBS00635.1 peptide chain release factor N(5)-glutamine methyltransferase [Acholeplasmataceae bacterium]HCB21376.1 peptide chain release factor N(5)-glutamine methyltransferase [Acholeplasmataceae bacterium]
MQVTFEKLLRLAYKKVAEKQGEEEAAKLLLMELSGLDPHAFFMAMKDEVSPELETLFLNSLSRYLDDKIPVQHVIGHSYFFGHKLYVNEHVLIPRPETEQLVEHVLYFYDAYFENQEINLLDLGTGSGCIGLTLAKEESHLHVTASDISEDALVVARKNKEALGVTADFVLSDLFQNIRGKFSILVSNPPYIPDSEVVDEIVQKEPSVALYGGSLGVDFYDKILKNAKPFLEEKALIAFEHGYQQKDVIASFVKTHYPDAIILQMKDLAGKDRFTFVGLNGVLAKE